jgi:NADH-quinone oxidoreductase subunit C
LSINNQLARTFFTTLEEYPEYWTMIYDLTREMLAALFPAVTGGDDQGEAEAAKDGARSNGLIERDYRVHGYHLDAQVDPDQLLEAVGLLDRLEYFLEAITGVDWIADNQLEVVYDFSRYDKTPCRVVIRTRIDRQNPQVPTITGIFAGANWHERETHDFFGISFIGHPHLIPLLLPEDADFHPLLKDFKA